MAAEAASAAGFTDLLRRLVSTRIIWTRRVETARRSARFCPREQSHAPARRLHPTSGTGVLRSQCPRQQLSVKMQVWMSNSHGSVAYQHQFFALIRNNLKGSRGLRVADRFQSLSSLADLPWLDQPRLLDPSLLIVEIYAAWDELWTLKLTELAFRPVLGALSEWDSSTNLAINGASDQLFGRFLAAPLHELAVFAAAASERGTVRAATHRQLIIGPSRRLRDWRVLQGGPSRPSQASRTQSPS